MLQARLESERVKELRRTRRRSCEEENRKHTVSQNLEERTGRENGWRCGNWQEVK